MIAIPKVIYLVMGKTGEYSERSEWPVCAYTSEADAKQHVLEATAYAQTELAFRSSEEWEESLDARFEAMGPDDDEDSARNRQNPFDPRFSMDYTGTEYWYETVTLKPKFTTPEAVN